jgi:hypothetical protein
VPHVGSSGERKVAYRNWRSSLSVGDHLDDLDIDGNITIGWMV